MEITVNGEAFRTSADSTIRMLINQLGFGERRIAVERNGEILPRSRHATTPLAEGDRIEIIQAIGGG